VKEIGLGKMMINKRIIIKNFKKKVIDDLFSLLGEPVNEQVSM
jgi:hypothetical protein